jgi:hypothetical protein
VRRSTFSCGPERKATDYTFQRQEKYDGQEPDAGDLGYGVSSLDSEQMSTRRGVDDGAHVIEKRWADECSPLDCWRHHLRGQTSSSREALFFDGTIAVILPAVPIFSDPSSSRGPARGRGCFLLKRTGHRGSINAATLGGVRYCHLHCEALRRRRKRRTQLRLRSRRP